MFEKKEIGLLSICSDWRLNDADDFPGIYFAIRRHAKRIAKEALGFEVRFDSYIIPGPDLYAEKVAQKKWSDHVGAIDLLVGAHDPKVIVVAGHATCAANSVDDRIHWFDVEKTTRTFAAQYPDLVVIGLLVHSIDLESDYCEVDTVVLVPQVPVQAAD